MNELYSRWCTWSAKFQGHWPVGAVIITHAYTQEDALEKINEELKTKGFKLVPLEAVEEVIGTQILLNGDY